MNVDLRALIGRLNHEARSAVEAAAGLCLSRTHYDVEIEHFLLKALDQSDNDVASILRHFGIDRSRLTGELTVSIDTLKSGNARTPSLAPSLVRMLSEAWSIASLDYGAPQIRTGHAVLALLVDKELKRVVQDSAGELQKISSDELRKDFHGIVAQSVEESAEAAAPTDADQAEVGKAGGKTPKLDQYTINLTARAQRGELDPVLCRDGEIRQMVDILTRRRQNNPILVGEAGVGKTAVAEGFARRVVAAEVPPPLRGIAIHTLDLALLQAGAGVKGEFENRLKGLIEEVKASPTPIILFIDEAHTLIGAGGQAGQGDAANLLKPALARGELRTIAATTWSEYKKYFEKDPALTRRFQLVKVDEPSEQACLVMMRGIVSNLERHHGVRILDEGVVAAVRLSHRYLPDRQLPDKAVSVLDTACARLALGQNATPAPIEDAVRTLDDLEVQERVLRREAATGADHVERLEEIEAERAATQARLDELEARWGEERTLVEEIRELRERIENEAEREQAEGVESRDGPVAELGDGTAEFEDGPVAEVENRGVAELEGGTADDVQDLREELRDLGEQLEPLQGETPLIPVTVDAELVSRVVSGWTGIPVGKMLRDDLSMALEMEQHLQRRIIGQDHALETISHRIRTSKAGIEDPSKPQGVFLLVGPSGVGKTETALALSDLLYGGEHNVITINMSEFQEAHTVSTLKGSPPGYVGYGEGGVLTEAVRRRPYSVVLLDEIEKAHPDVLELFFQVFDKGRLEDGEGRQIDFKNTIILLTTNIGTETIMRFAADPERIPDDQELVRALKPHLDRSFKQAFLGRTVVIPYLPVRDEVLEQIIRLKIGRIQRRLQDTHGLELVVDDGVVDAVAERCTEVESGARNVDKILTNTVLPSLSRLLLQSLVHGTRPAAMRVAVRENGEFTYGLDAESAAAMADAVPAGSEAENRSPAKPPAEIDAVPKAPAGS